MNMFVGCGNLTRDPERRSTNTGMAVTSFTIAINRPTSKGKEKVTDFVPITAFGQTAEVCAQYLKKGSKCIVEGMCATSTYTGKDGQNHFKMEIIANRVEFVSMPQNTQNTQPVAQTVQNTQSYEQVDIDEDLPF